MNTNVNLSGQITIIPKPELRGFFGDSHTKPPFKVTSAEVAIICPDLSGYKMCSYPPIFVGRWVVKAPRKKGGNMLMVQKNSVRYIEL